MTPSGLGIAGAVVSSTLLLIIRDPSAGEGADLEGGWPPFPRSVPPGKTPQLTSTLVTFSCRTDVPWSVSSLAGGAPFARASYKSASVRAHIAMLRLLSSIRDLAHCNVARLVNVAGRALAIRAAIWSMASSRVFRRITCLIVLVSTFGISISLATLQCSDPKSYPQPSHIAM